MREIRDLELHRAVLAWAASEGGQAAVDEGVAGLRSRAAHRLVAAALERSGEREGAMAAIAAVAAADGALRQKLLAALQGR